MSRTLVAYHPGNDFVPVSITGPGCRLQCEHCKGHFLQHMIDASNPGSLITIANDVMARGGTGILISGGCDVEGRLPLMSRLDEIREIVVSGLRVNVHTGHVTKEEARRLGATGADRFSMDLHQSPSVIEEVLHLPGGPARFISTLEALCEAVPYKVTPHICAGLEGDQIINEKRCIDLVKGEDIAGVVILGHVAVADVSFRPRPPISDLNLLKLIRYAVETLDKPVLLGCMRERRTNWLELNAARAGVAGIANPKADTLRTLEKEGFTISHQLSCCALHL